MPQFLKSLMIGAALFAALPAAAQDTTPAAPAADQAAPTEQPAQDGIGSVYVASEHGSWQLRCVRTEDGSDPCQLYQLLKDADGNSVAEINIVNLPEGKEAVAGATVITPLETLLTAQLGFQVDANKGKRYPYSWCTQTGCFARVGFTGDELAALKKGNKASVVIVPVAAPDKTVTVDASLSGFTAGYDALVAANTKK